MQNYKKSPTPASFPPIIFQKFSIQGRKRVRPLCALLGVKGLKDVLQQLFSVCFLSGDLPQRNRIRGIAMEHTLVDVEPDADDTVLDEVALQRVLYQDTCQFAIAPIDIVRPLD
jgi:hypothetical protein